MHCKMFTNVVEVSDNCPPPHTHTHTHTHTLIPVMKTIYPEIVRYTEVWSGGGRNHFQLRATTI